VIPQICSNCSGRGVIKEGQAALNHVRRLVPSAGFGRCDPCEGSGFIGYMEEFTEQDLMTKNELHAFWEGYDDYRIGRDWYE